MMYPWTIYDIFEALKVHLGTSKDSLTDYRNELFVILGLMELVVMVILAIFMIFITHRVAGPLYKLGKTFKEIKDEGIFRRVYFRKNDNFQDLAQDFNELIDFLQDERESSRELLEESLQILKKEQSGNAELKEVILKIEMVLFEKMRVKREDEDQ